MQLKGELIIMFPSNITLMFNVTFNVKMLRKGLEHNK
jgi:hypothetical protein